MPRVRVFSTPSCPYCYTLKEWLKEHQVEFEDIDVAKDAEAREEMIQKSKQLGAPVIDIDGQFIAGFDKEQISKLLNLK